MNAGCLFIKLPKKTGRHRKTIANFIKNKETYGKNFKGGNNRVITDADRRSILREASNSHDSSAKIREKCGVNASKSTIQRVIKKADHLKRQKLKKKPPLNKLRKETRLSFARTHMTWSKEWQKLIES